jgi:hypothetical protein
LQKIEWVYYGKLPGKVEKDLAKANYLRGSKGRLEVHSDLFGILLCLIAKYLSRALSYGADFYSIYTSGIDFEHCNFEPIDPDRSERCIQVVLDQFLPVPSETVPLEDILKFKMDHEGELLAFRRALDKVYADVAREGPEERVIVALKDDLSAGLSKIDESLRRSSIETVLLSMSVLVATGMTAGASVLTSNQTVSTVIPWTFSGIAPAALLTIMDRVKRAGNLHGPFSYLHKTIHRFR